VLFRPIRTIVLSCAAASAVVLSACSSGSSSPGAGSSPAATSSAAPAAAAGSPIQILTVNTLDQPAANQPEGVAAEQAAVLAINNSGGIKGHPVKLTVCNNDFNPNGSVACARQAATGPYVAVVGGWYIPGDAQAVPIETAADIANIGMTATAQIDATAGNWFPIDGGVFTGYPAVGSILKQYAPSVKRVAVVQTDVPNSTAAAALVTRGLAFAGLQQAGTVTVPFAATDYSSYAAKIQQDKPDAVAFVTSGDQGTAMLKAMAQLGIDLPFVAPGQGYSASAVSAIGPMAAKGLFFSYNLPPGDTSNPGVARFLSELGAGATAGIQNASPTQITGASFESWLAVHLFAQVAAGITGPVTRASVLTAMEKAKDVDMFGIEPPYTAPPGPDPGWPRIAADHVYTLKIVDGVMQLETPSEQPIHILQQGFRAG
jgi:ABC-type branched-subunit amino acid transport system substrate-binding protein